MLRLQGVCWSVGELFSDAKCLLVVFKGLFKRTFRLQTAAKIRQGVCQLSRVRIFHLERENKLAEVL